MLYTFPWPSHESGMFVHFWCTDSGVESMPSKPGSARLRAFQGTRSDVNDALACKGIVLQRVLRKIASSFPASKPATTDAVRLLQTLHVTIWWG